MPSEDQNDIVRLAAATNPFQAHIWQQALQQEGIRCQVLGDYLDAGIGDIPGMRRLSQMKPRKVQVLAAGRPRPARDAAVRLRKGRSREE